MKKRYVLVFALSLIAGTLGWAFGTCTPGKTTIIVKDCDGAPVANARVTVKICCGDSDRTEVQSTNSDGAAIFSASRKDICEREIILAGFAESKGVLGGCEGSDKDSTCEVQICPR